MNILINPKTGKEYENVPVRIAAEYLDVAPGLIRHGLIEKRLPIGTAFPPQSEGGKWKLLEKGHQARNGSHVEPIKHIAPLERKAAKSYESKIIKLIKSIE